MTYFEDQLEAWLDGGCQAYCEENDIKPEDHEGGVPADFNPYEFWADQN
ncbi:MAG: hypothetical protein KAS32_12440 [Candidatus Peribacteraceae bacterium]|nr:hypothetical protein [Candidatus Peribacteraceae bacterium]